jgi:DNA-directed RNA polymerase specialized sigma24 family protein
VSSSDRANRLVASLSQYFEPPLPENLGEEGLRSIKKYLKSNRLAGDLHAEEVFAAAIANAFRYLRFNGGTRIRHPRGWFHTLCRRACFDYLAFIQPSGAGEENLSAAPNALSDEQTQVIVRQAIQRLHPRHQRFIRLDLVECRPADQIQESLHIPSDGAFRKLKYEAFKALRKSIRELVASGVGQIF